MWQNRPKGNLYQFTARGTNILYYHDKKDNYLFLSQQKTYKEFMQELDPQFHNIKMAPI